PTERKEDTGARRRESQAPGGPPPQQVPCAPAYRDKDPNGREVGVAVGHGLRSDLDQADHRNKRAQEPEQSYRQIRSPRGRPDRQQRYGQNEEERARNLTVPPGDPWVADCQIIRPEDFPAVARIRYGRIGTTWPQGQGAQFGDRARLC